MKKIMFVCTGNTCRSVMAEYLLKAKVKKKGLKSIEVSSAGLCVTESQINIDARKALRGFGITVRKFVPKQVDVELASQQTLVVCMTEEQKKLFVGFDNVFSFAEITKLGDVADPFGSVSDIYVDVAKILDSGCDIILKKVLKKGFDVKTLCE